MPVRCISSGRTRGRDVSEATRDPKRSPRVVRDARTASPVERDAPLRGLGRSLQVLDRVATGKRRRDIGPSR